MATMTASFVAARPVAAKRAAALAPARALGCTPLAIKPRARAFKPAAAAPVSASLKEQTVQARAGARAAPLSLRAPASLTLPDWVAPAPSPGGRGVRGVRLAGERGERVRCAGAWRARAPRRARGAGQTADITRASP